MKKMIKQAVFLCLALALLLQLPAGAATAKTGFSDVPAGAWYEFYIAEIQRAPGIIDGYEDGTFRPHELVKRGEFLKMLIEAQNMSGIGMITSDHSRDKVHWAGKYYTLAAESNLLVADVYSGGVMFECSYEALEQPISRYEMAVILNNLCTNVAMDSVVVIDTEIIGDHISDYGTMTDTVYVNAVEQVSGKKLLEGDENGCFNGEDSLTRAQAATVIYRFLFQFNLNGEDLAPYASRPKAEDINAAPPGFVSFATRYQSMSESERRIALFGDANKTYFTSAADAAGYMVTITIPIWTMDKSGNKFASSMPLTVHKLVADEVQYIFQEIFDDPERFPIYGGWSVGGSRYTDTLRHSWGCAIDINAFYNCECTINWNSGLNTVTCGYGWWPEGTQWTAFAGSMSSPSPYSISADSSVVRAFAKYGWGWGGQGYSLKSNGNQKFDYMHFSILPSGG